MPPLQQVGWHLQHTRSGLYAVVGHDCCCLTVTLSSLCRLTDVHAMHAAATVARWGRAWEWCYTTMGPCYTTAVGQYTVQPQPSRGPRCSSAAANHLYQSASSVTDPSDLAVSILYHPIPTRSLHVSLPCHMLYPMYVGHWLDRRRACWHNLTRAQLSNLIAGPWTGAARWCM